MDKLRDFLKGRVGQAIMLACLAPMVFLGMEGYLSGGQLTADQVARVGDVTITVGELHDEVNATRGQLTQSVDSSLINEDALTSQALETMINRALLETQSKALGMRVSDATITAMLQNDPTFADANGQFSNDRFASFLQSQHLTKDRLFEMQRRQLNLRMLMNGILTTTIYPNSQISRLLDLQFESRELWVKRLAWQNYVAQVSVSSDEILAYYNANKETLVRPNQVDLSYIELTSDGIDVPAPTDDELKAAYQSYLRANNQGQKELSQILLTGDNAMARAESLKKELAAGATFEDLAKTHSDDPSGKSGGKIGQYNPAVFGADASKVDSAIAALGQGDVSEAVETSFGVHLFKVLGVSDAPSFDSLQSMLQQQVINEKRQALLSERISAINAMVADGFGLKDIASEMQLTVKSLPNYQDKNQAVMGQPAIVRAAFDEFTIADGGVSGNIELSGTTLWVQPSNYRASALMTLEEATETIKQKLTIQKASQLAFADAQKQAESLTKEGLSSLSAVGVATRQTAVLNEAELASLFIKDAPKDGLATWAVQTDIGASVMAGGAIGVEAKSRMSEQDKAMAALMIKNVAAQDYLEDYLHHLRSVHAVELNEKALKGSQDHFGVIL